MFQPDNYRPLCDWPRAQTLYTHGLTAISQALSASGWPCTAPYPSALTPHRNPQLSGALTTSRTPQLPPGWTPSPSPCSHLPHEQNHKCPISSFHSRQNPSYLATWRMFSNYFCIMVVRKEFIYEGYPQGACVLTSP